MEVLSRFCFSAARNSTYRAFPDELCHRFSVSEIRRATHSFNDSQILGTGTSNTVYEGIMDDGTTVAIKRYHGKSQWMADAFEKEVRLLCQIHHPNLVSLIGFCYDKNEMILVYEYMDNGTLLDLLCKTTIDPLPWKLRLKICIGVARGLHYLHTGVKQGIVNRRVKSSNIFFDKNWEPHLENFGISEKDYTNEMRPEIMKHDLDYFGPEHYVKHAVTEKSDVYSFGVVLFEVLCAKKAIDINLQGGLGDLARWAVECIREETLCDMIDPHLLGKIAPKCLMKFVEIASSCIRPPRYEWLAMGEVEVELENALDLQEEAEASGSEADYNYEGMSFSCLLQPSKRLPNYACFRSS